MAQSLKHQLIYIIKKLTAEDPEKWVDAISQDDALATIAGRICSFIDVDNDQYSDISNNNINDNNNNYVPYKEPSQLCEAGEVPDKSPSPKR